jgi:hypothetical protein
MEWEDKVKMIQLGKDTATKNEFQNFCLYQIPNFDDQAWDMFCNLIEIIPDEMKKDIEFWEKVWPELKIIDCTDDKFGLRSGMRIALLQVICKEELNFS